jgi:hypothetical protein
MVVDLQTLAVIASFLVAASAVIGTVAGYKVALHRITVLERRVDHSSMWRDDHVKEHGEVMQRVTEEMGKLREVIAKLTGKVDSLLNMEGRAGGGHHD